MSNGDITFIMTMLCTMLIAVVGFGMYWTVVIGAKAWRGAQAKRLAYKERARLNTLKFLDCTKTVWAEWLKMTNDRKLKLLPELLGNPRLAHGVECCAETSHGWFNLPIKEINCSLGGADDKVFVHFEAVANKEGVVEVAHFIYKGTCLKSKYMCLSMSEGDTLKLHYNVEMEGDK